MVVTHSQETKFISWEEPERKETEHAATNLCAVLSKDPRVVVSENSFCSDADGQEKERKENDSVLSLL